MARGRGGIPNYPSPKSIQKTALALARASLPTKRSVMSDYNRSLRDTSGFTDAILGQLRGAAGQIGGAATTRRSRVSPRLTTRLSSPDGAWRQYGAGSAAAVGGIGDAQQSRLISQKAAATNYGAQLPSVAAARGQLLHAGLIQQRGEALKTRSDNLRQAYTQALQQVQDSALARAVAGANIKNANAQLGLQRQSLALQQQSMAESRREFDANFGPKSKFIASPGRAVDERCAGVGEVTRHDAGAGARCSAMQQAS
jgi:hypothetical protein